MEERININIDEDMNEILLKDMRDFKIIHTNGEPNKSHFICLLIKNFIDEYMQNIEQRIDSTADQMVKNFGVDSNKAKQVVTKIVFSTQEQILSIDNNKKKKKDIHWPISITKAMQTKTAEILEMLPAEIDYSAFFRNMLSIYISLPRYKREWLLQKDTYDKISEAKRKYGLEIKYRGYPLDYIIYPLEIVHDTRQEMFNYVIANTVNGIRSYHLSDISDIINVKKAPALIPDNYNDIFPLMKKNGIQFGVSKPEYYYIELSKKEYKTFRNRYFDRPEIIKKEEFDDGSVRLYFDCSWFQLEKAYLNPFGRIVELHEYDPNLLVENSNL